MSEGQIFKIHSDFYYVDDGVTFFECKIREVLKKQKQKILVGDFVEFDNGVINKILPRKNYISRPSVANIDQIIIVSALKEPDLDLKQLNRYIALSKFYKIDIKLCFNKSDLEFDNEIKKKIEDIYKPLGFEIIITSATEHSGIKAFEKLLNGKISVLCGNSGVGKSSLINSINPNFKLRVNQVSEKTQRGTHTTRHCEIIKISNNARIIDTPGFSNVRFDFLLPIEVDSLFDEIFVYKQNCKYSDCLHINELDCDVLANIDKIDASRYESYLDFVNEAKDYKEKVKYEGRKVEQSQKIVNNKAMVKISERKRQSARNNLKAQAKFEDIDE
ncbi:MAG: ribosome small subunit-dependent GTPase A [Candidatus Gastranaerophilales bacterium]